MKESLGGLQKAACLSHRRRPVGQGADYLQDCPGLCSPQVEAARNRLLAVRGQVFRQPRPEDMQASQPFMSIGQAAQSEALLGIQQGEAPGPVLIALHNATGRVSDLHIWQGEITNRLYLLSQANFPTMMGVQRH